MTKYNIKVIFAFFVFTIIISCSSRNKDLKPSSNVKEIEIPNNIDKPLPWDSLISDIKIIPLETNNNCLIGKITRISNLNDKFYIQDKRNKVLFVFDENGKFLFKLDKKGKAGGEYLELRDFKVDKEGNIYILDFQKIIKYSPSGEHLATISLNKFEGEEECNHLNPLEFALGRNGEYYMFNGSMGIMQSLKNQYAIYKINSQGKITKRYLSIKRPVTYWENMYYEYDQGYHIQPMLGNDTIYSIKEGQFYASYYINSGKRKFSEDKLPNREDNFYPNAIRITNSGDYCYNFQNIIETDNSIVFNFWNKGRLHYVFKSKESKKQIIGKQYICNRIRPFFFNCTYKDYLVSIMEAYILKSTEKNISTEDYKEMTDIDKLIINRVKNMDNLSNPALLFIKVKPF